MKILNLIKINYAQNLKRTKPYANNSLVNNKLLDQIADDFQINLLGNTLFQISYINYHRIWYKLIQYTYYFFCYNLYVDLDFCTQIKKTKKYILLIYNTKYFTGHDNKIIKIKVEILSNICIKNLK